MALEVTRLNQTCRGLWERLMAFQADFLTNADLTQLEVVNESNGDLRLIHLMSLFPMF